MSRITRFVLGGVAACAIALTAAAASAAQVDHLLKLHGIDGESAVPGYEDWIEVDSFSWGMSQSGTGRPEKGGGGGKLAVQDMSFLKDVDKSSPLLMVATASGKPIACATLVGLSGGEKPEPRYTYELKNVYVTQYAVEGKPAGAMDQFSLNFARVQMTYTPQDAGGQKAMAVLAGWDFVRNMQYGTQDTC